MNEETQGSLSEEEIAEISKTRSYEYQLEWPVEIGNMEPIITIDLKRFNGGQIKAVMKVKEEFEKGIKMVELSSGLTPIQVDAIDAVDLISLIEICSVFMSASQRKRQKNIGG